MSEVPHNEKEGGSKSSTVQLSPIPPSAFSEIQSLYDAGLCLQAFQVAEQFGPLGAWTGSAARVLAGRLAGNLGGYRLGQALHWLAWRAQKYEPDLVAYHGHGLLQRRGPLATLQFLERYGSVQPHPDTEGVLHLLTLRAEVAAHLRDFSESWEWLRRAGELNPNHPWLARVQAEVFELEDRYPEALEAARRALALRPWYRPGVQVLAHTLQLLDRDEEALALLTEAAQRIENLHVVRQLSALQLELGMYGESAASLERLVGLAPLLEEAEREWVLRQRIKIDCLRQERAGALARARQVPEPFYRELAERLEKGVPFRQVRLAVPFVRQHHLTCAPATLAALSRFWRQPADHLEVAEAICYDGTPSHSERHWAESHGWAAREFRVTWEAAVGLLERGIPFTLTTRAATSGHLQAVVGYDELRRCLWIRDPFVYYASEFAIEPLLEQQRASGPRGMALVPASQAALLEGLTLPEAALYDQLYRVERALAQYRRAEALVVCGEMQAARPEHRLTLTARRALAAYDGNMPALLACLEELLRQFPEDENLNLCKLGCLQNLSRRSERLELFERLSVKPGIDPIFWRQYAQELRADARQLGTAASWVRWALRYRPTDAALVSAWADLLWDERQFVEATRFYRLAACLDDKNERPAQSYFISSRHLGQTEQALSFLRERSARLGRKASGPAMTLVESLQHLRRTREALEVLAGALALRPADAPLRLFAADCYGRISRFEEAARLLEEAQNHCAPIAWLRTAAELAGYKNEKKAALSYWRQVLELDPLAQDAIRAAALLLAETEGRQAALKFLEERCQRFPFCCPLLALRVQWLGEDGDAGVVPELRRLLEVNPADAWAWRELALKLAAAGQQREALEAAEEAIRLDPQASAGYAVRGELLLQEGRAEEGRRQFRKAVELEVDNAFAVSEFVASAPTLAERRKALAEVALELRRQVIFSEALAAYQSAARGVLEPPEVLGLLRDAHRARPDLWQAWSVLVHQLIDQGAYEEALKTAQEATERFPLLPRLWVDLARVHQARLEVAAETVALEKALEISPSYSFAAQQLAEIYERQNELAKARAVLEQAVAASPLEAPNHGCLADVLWKQKEPQAAIARLQHALRLDPGYNWGWRALREWEGQTGRPNLAREMAEDLTRCRSGEARSWLLLAQSLSPESESEKLFAALERASELNPRCESAFDERARVLARLNRFEEALGQCAPPALQPAPIRLLVRAAWVEAQRGNLSLAIAKAKAALAEHPDFYEGWQLLSDWALQNQDPAQALEAAERMVGLAPLAAVPLGYLGELKLQLKDREGAQAAFARAFALDPEYEYAGVELFKLQLAERQLDPAEQTLQVLERRGADHRALACAVKLAVARQRFDEARSRLESLCAADTVAEVSLVEAVQALDGSGQKRKVDQVLEQAMAGGRVAPPVACFWVERQVRRGRWGVHQRLGLPATEEKAAREAVLRYLDLMGEAFGAARQKRDLTTPLSLRYHLYRLLKRHRAWLRTDLEGWGKVGYVLTCIGRPGPVVEWLGDWKNRPRAESWMLYNLIIMLQRKGRYEESREVVRHAVNLPHGHDLYELFRLWAAFEEALLGNTAAARLHLANLPVQSTHASFQPVRAMTEILIGLHGGPAAEKKEALGKVRVQLAKAFGPTRPAQATGYVRDAYRRFMAVVARDALWLRLWGWWFYRGPVWLWLLALPVLVPVTIVLPQFWIIALVVLAFSRRSR